MNYLGFIDKIEFNDKNAIIYFDSISLRSGRKLIKNGDKDEINKIKTYRLIREMKKTSRNLNYFEEGAWYILRERAKGYKFTIYKDINDDKNTINNLRVKKLDKDKGMEERLSEFFSLNDVPDAAEDEIINLAPKNKVPQFVGVYNVGQGNCNAVCDEFSAPILYFDFGGGCAANSKTYPKGQRFCMSYDPPIILSHWDSDHWVSATKGRFPNAMDRKWLTPRQRLGPSHLALAHQLHSKGNLLVWPSTVRSLPINGIGEIFKCNGTSLNNSGLGLITKFNNKRILLPGDTDYVYINNNFLNNLDGLVTSHHGAKISSKKYPVPSPHVIVQSVYSFGHNNTYKHPKLSSLKGHIRVGWKKRLYSPKGHSGIGIGVGIKPMLGCGKKDCDLEITQV